MNVLSLFDGMSCGQIALNEMGVTVDNYYASELDKFAIKESQENWPNMIHLGDVTKWREWDINWHSIDLLIGGSPCQGFSFAGKQLAFDDPRSALFFVYVDILNHIKSVNPQVRFMLENVKMKKEYLQVITDQLGVEPVFINSNEIVPQDRPRHYWFNWDFAPVVSLNRDLQHYIDKENKTENKQGWHTWFELKKEWRIKKKYICILNDSERAITQVARQVASWAGNIVRVSPGKYRFFSVKEASRLQGAPDDYFKVSSNTQAYKMLGNGWQIDTIKHIFSTMVEIKREKQLKLFKADNNDS